MINSSDFCSVQWVSMCNISPYLVVITRKAEGTLASSPHMGFGDGLFRGDPRMRSGGMRKLACVESSLQPVCSDQKTISFFVWCHCLRCNLGWITRWHSLRSRGVPFVRKGKKKLKKMGGTRKALNPGKVLRLLVVCAHISRHRIGRRKFAN